MIALSPNGGQLLTEAAALATGEEAGVLGRLNHAFQVTNSAAGSFTVLIEGSLDGSNFTTVSTISAANTVTQVQGVYSYLRAKVSAIAGGAKVTVHYRGF